jgi:2-polyprenyl-3-methyl-5-hydroxy-6-metoxy-1,4-benzoquinol methylase
VRRHRHPRDYYDEVHYSSAAIAAASRAKLAVSDPWYALILELLERNDVRVAGRVLEVGCGLGGFSQRLSTGGAWVTGCDFSLSALGAASRHASDRGSSVRFIAADARRLPFVDGSFDVVVCAETLEHTFALATCVRELHRVSVPGGFVAVTVPNAAMAFPLGLIVHAIGADQPQVLVTPSRLVRHMREAGLEVVDGDGTSHFRDMILNDVLPPRWRARAERLAHAIGRAAPRARRRWTMTAGTFGILARRPERDVEAD